MTFKVTDGEGVQALYHNRDELRIDGWGVTDRESGSCAVSINTGTFGSGGGALSVAAGTALIDGTETEIAQQTVDVPAPGSSPRKDVIVIDGFGEAGLVAGTAEAKSPSGSPLETAERPAPPDLSNMDVVPLAIVLVAADATSLTTSDLIDARPTGDLVVGSVEAASALAAEQLGLPIYENDPDAPPETLYFYPPDPIVKYKDSTGVVHEAGGAVALSELSIDTAKGWNNYSITNVNELDASLLTSLEADLADRLGLPTYTADTDAPLDSLYFNTTTKVITYKASDGTLYGGSGGLSDLLIDSDKDWQGYSISNMDALETEFTTHSNTLDSDYTIPAGKGSVVAGELSGTGSISGDGELAVIDEGIHNDVRNPLEADVDAAGYSISNIGSIGANSATVTNGVSAGSMETPLANGVVVVTPDMSAADINAAITNDLPAEGGVVEFRPGTYTVDVEPIDLSKPYLYFRGLGDVTITIAATFQSNIIANVAGQNNEFFGMSHLELVGNRTADGSNELTTANQAAVRAQHTKAVSVEDVRIADTVDGSLNVGGAYTDFLFVRDSRFEYAGHLAHATTDAHIIAPGGTDIYLTECYFDWATDNAIYLNNCTSAYVAGCRFHDVFVNAFDTNMNNVKYIGCDITGAPPRGNAHFYFPLGGSHSVTIRDCDWHDLGTMPASLSNAIRALSGLSPPVEDVTIEGCTFELNNELNAFRWEDRGTGIRFRDNYIIDPAGGASRCDDSVDLSMTGNTVKYTTNATSTAGNALMLVNVADSTLADNHVIDERASLDSITNAYRVADTANGNADGVIVENNTAVGTSGASHNIDLDYPFLRYNGLAYNAGDPSTTGQWTGNGIEGLVVRDTTNGFTHIYNNGTWSQIAGS